MKIPRPAFLLLALCLAAAPLTLRSQPSAEQVRALPPLPKDYEQEPSGEKRIAWLQQRLTQSLDAAERYRTQRTLFGEFFGAHRRDEAARLCERNPPLREDLIYRGNCIVASHPAREEQLPRLQALVAEAREQGKPAAAALLLKDVAWRQSQAGDIAGAFVNYALALSLLPAEQVELLGEIMMDAATSYIVNGDPSYIHKGIALLTEARQRMEKALQDPADGADKAVLRENIALTDFNRGIAYLLHLGDPDSALAHFDRAASASTPIVEDSLVFAALAAAELGRYPRAQAFLARADREASGGGGPVVQQYLRCYRQLAIRHWQAQHTLSACLQLLPDTATEVQLDVYKRLAKSEDPAMALAGLKGLKTLFLEKIEPQLRRRGSSAASNAELQRLQRESELKSLALQQSEALQRERDATNAQRQYFLAALTGLLLMVALLVALQWRAKKKLAEQYERLSLTDTLTQLGNRRFLEQQIGRELASLARARRKHPEASLGVYLFDVDHFKSINDRYGHAIGDEVLVTLSRRIQAATRATDLLVRWGGEEFLLVARLDTPAHASQVAQRILSAVNGTPFEISGQAPIPVSCTIGALRLPFVDGDNAPLWPAVVGLADLALYEGKASGRNRWVLVENRDLRDLADLNQVLQQPLRQSVEAGRLALVTA